MDFGHKLDLNSDISLSASNFSVSRASRSRDVMLNRLRDVSSLVHSTHDLLTRELLIEMISKMRLDDVIANS